MRRILVLRGGALGDFVVTLPALAALKRHWPDAHLVLIGNARAAVIGLAEGLINDVHAQDEARWSGLFTNGPLPDPLVSWLCEFDLVLNYWPDPDGTLGRHFPIRPGQRFISAAALPAEVPAAAHYCAPLRELGISVRDFHYRFTGTSGLATSSVPLDGTARIAIHPGSGSRSKNWPFENWRELLRRIEHPILLILGDAEHDHWGAMSGSNLGVDVRIAAGQPLLELAAEISRCRLFLGHDSGISHVAAATGIPSILLFGPTDPIMWAPPAPHVRVIRSGDTLTAITVSMVLSAVDQALGSRHLRTSK